MNTRELGTADASALATTLLSGCVITAVSSLSATLSVELTRASPAGDVPNTLRLQTFVPPKAATDDRAIAACRALLGTNTTSDENLATIAGALLLLSLQALAAPLEGARVTAEGALEVKTSPFGWLRFAALGDASEESSWTLDVPPDHPGEGGFLEASGDGKRLTSSFGAPRR